MQHFRTQLSETESALYAALIGEENRQREGVELIPSENYTYPEVLALLRCGRRAKSPCSLRQPRG